MAGSEPTRLAVKSKANLTSSKVIIRGRIAYTGSSIVILSSVSQVEDEIAKSNDRRRDLRECRALDSN